MEVSSIAILLSLLVVSLSVTAETPEEKSQDAITEACHSKQCPERFTALSAAEKPQAEVRRMSNEIFGASKEKDSSKGKGTH